MRRNRVGKLLAFLGAAGMLVGTATSKYYSSRCRTLNSENRIGYAQIDQRFHKLYIKGLKLFDYEENVDFSIPDNFNEYEKMIKEYVQASKRLEKDRKMIRSNVEREVQFARYASNGQNLASVSIVPLIIGFSLINRRRRDKGISEILDEAG